MEKESKKKVKSKSSPPKYVSSDEDDKENLLKQHVQESQGKNEGIVEGNWNLR
jgi:hypothetical protein